MNPQRNVDYDLGQLEGKVDGLTVSVNQLLEGQKEAAESADRGRRRLHRKLEAVSEKITINSTRVENLQILAEAQGKSIEALQGTVESHDRSIDDLQDRAEGQGRALESLEDFHEAHKIEDVKQRATVENNKKMVRGIGLGLAGIAAIEGDHASGGKFLKWLGSVFTK